VSAKVTEAEHPCWIVEMTADYLFDNQRRKDEESGAAK
jgi:hypothetical protein